MKTENKYIWFDSREEMEDFYDKNSLSLSDLEIISPYPVENGNRKKTISKRIAIVALISSIIAFIGGIIIINTISANIYSINTGGKPAFSFIAAMPILFEFTVLITGISVFIAFIYYARLGNEIDKQDIPKMWGICFKEEYNDLVTENKS